jgi:hypothetical protein
MPTTTVGAAASLSEPGLRGEFFRRFQPLAEASWATKLSLPVSSDKAEEVYTDLSDTPAMQEWIGERKFKTLVPVEYRILNKAFHAGLAIKSADKRRDRLGLLNARLGQLASRAARHPEKLIAALINGNGTCYDGKAFFATDHKYPKLADAPTINNAPTASQITSLNVGTPAAPTALELALILSDLIAWQRGYKDTEGEPCNEDASSFVFMCPATWGGAAVQAVKDNLLISGSVSVVNPAVRTGQTIELVQTTRFTGTTTCCLFRSDADLKPFIWQEELPITPGMLGENSEYEKLHQEQMFFVDWTGNAGYGWPTLATLATLS